MTTIKNYLMATIKNITTEEYKIATQEMTQETPKENISAKIIIKKQYKIATIEEMNAFDNMYFAMCNIVDSYCDENSCKPEDIGSNLEEQYNFAITGTRRPKIQRNVVFKSKKSKKPEPICNKQGKLQGKSHQNRNIQLKAAAKIAKPKTRTIETITLFNDKVKISCQLVPQIVIDDEEEEIMEIEQENLLKQKQEQMRQEREEKERKEKQEKERLEKERQEQMRQEKERIEKERDERIEKERQEREEKERKEKEEKQRQEKERKEKEEKVRKENFKKTSKTALCKSVVSGTQCPHGSRCNYAHKFEDVAKIQCKNITNCWHVEHKGDGQYQNVSERICKFWHQNETVYSYFKRQGVNIPKPKVVQAPITLVSKPAIIAPWAKIATEQKERKEKEEKERQEKERQEKERQEREEKERQERERQEKELQQRQEKERQERERQEKELQQRQEKERQERERQERQEKERKEKEEKERQERELQRQQEDEEEQKIKIIMEKTNEYINEHAQQFIKNEKPDPRQNTRLCKSVINGENCIHKKCNFAHSVDDLKKTTCNFGYNCFHVCKSGQTSYKNKSDRVCNYIHPNESNESYAKRIGVEYKKITVEVPYEIFEETLQLLASKNIKYFTITMLKNSDKEVKIPNSLMLDILKLMERKNCGGYVLKMY